MRPLALSSVRINRLKTIAQVQGQSRHAMRLDEIAQKRLREGAEGGTCLAWSKAPDGDPRDLLAAFKAHKRETGAGERKGSPLMLQALCVVSPEWIEETGGLHDPGNPRNVALFDAAKAWAEEWAGKGSVINARLDLDERGGGVVDVCISPVRLSRGKPQISTNKPLQDLKAATGERNEFAALQTSWADYAAKHLDPSILRGTRKQVTNREHVSPELYGQMKDEARKAAQQEYEARMKRLADQEDEVVFGRQRMLDDRRALDRQREELRKHIEAAKATYEKARHLLASAEAVAALIPAELVKAFGTLRTVTQGLFSKIGWLDEKSKFTASAEITPEQQNDLMTTSRTIRAVVQLQEVEAEIEAQGDLGHDDTPNGPE